MDRYGILDHSTVRNHQTETGSQVPAYVTAMLQNVRLVRSSTAPPVEHSGEFWYWILTSFGFAVMRTLVRASPGGFVYAETFMHPDISANPQLVLLETISAALEDELADSSLQPDWALILDQSLFLYQQHILINPIIFQYHMNYLVTQIQQASYDLSGNRIYTLPSRK